VECQNPVDLFVDLIESFYLSHRIRYGCGRSKSPKDSSSRPYSNPAHARAVVSQERHIIATRAQLPSIRDPLPLPDLRQSLTSLTPFFTEGSRCKVASGVFYSNTILDRSMRRRNSLEKTSHYSAALLFFCFLFSPFVSFPVLTHFRVCPRYLPFSDSSTSPVAWTGQRFDGGDSSTFRPGGPLEDEFLTGISSLIHSEKSKDEGRCFTPDCVDG